MPTISINSKISLELEAIINGIYMSIQQVKLKTRGFKSANAFRIAILFHLGDLALFPYFSP